VARAAVIADHITLMSLLVTEHHTGEDKHVWPNLIERVPGEIPLVHVMEEQHAGVHAGIYGTPTPPRLRPATGMALLAGRAGAD